MSTARPTVAQVRALEAEIARLRQIIEESPCTCVYGLPGQLLYRCERCRELPPVRIAV